jgi:acyl-CoA synthetase (NDP forming)
MMIASSHGTGFNKFVSSGNEADLRTEDFIEYFANDRDTKFILSFIEGIRDGKKFLKVSKDATRKKPFIVLKAGTTSAGTRAASSHTSALAGSNVINNAAFRQAGIIRARNGTEMQDLVRAFPVLPLPKGRRVGILTAGGGAGVLAADACERVGLEVPKLSDYVIEELNKYLPPFWSHDNPIDITASGGTFGGAGLAAMTKPLEELLKCDDIDSVIMMSFDFIEMADSLISNLPRKYHGLKGISDLAGSVGGRLMDGFIKIIKNYDKTAVTMGISGSESEINKTLESNGILTYSEPERAAFVLSKLAEYREYLESSDEPP